jgi:hypothetical protein
VIQNKKMVLGKLLQTKKKSLTGSVGDGKI